MSNKSKLLIFGFDQEVKGKFPNFRNKTPTERNKTQNTPEKNFDFGYDVQKLAMKKEHPTLEIKVIEESSGDR